MRVEKQEFVTGQRALPIVQYGAVKYYVDLRLKGFWNTADSQSFIDFDSERGRFMCEHLGVILCPECGTGAIISPAMDRRKLRCVQCYNLIIPVLDI